MKILMESIGHYCNYIDSKRSFSMAGFSDAEWFCILGGREGEKTGLGQILSSAHGLKLLDILRRRQGDDRFIFAIPKCIYDLPSFCNGEIDWFLGNNSIKITAQERDMLTDDLAREGKLHQFVRTIRRAERAVMIGPEPLRCMVQPLKLEKFIPISTPNFHLEDGGIERVVNQALEYGKPGVYLVSAGVSAAVIIDGLHERIKGGRGTFIIDCGSIWDAFAGIGGQRQWRAELYANLEKLEEWKRKCLYGK